eukprot:g19757.t1
MITATKSAKDIEAEKGKTVDHKLVLKKGLTYINIKRPHSRPAALLTGEPANVQSTKMIGRIANDSSWGSLIACLLSSGGHSNLADALLQAGLVPKRRVNIVTPNKRTVPAETVVGRNKSKDINAATTLT